MDKYAVIDLGTNTFHILIASIGQNNEIIEHFRDRRYIHLAEDGIKKIGDKAYHRALNCLLDFRKYLDKHEIKQINCSGTAALRTASNGLQLIEEILEQTRIKVNLISGIEEARYIFLGVQLAVPQINKGNHVIMDIGGGSVEFIIIKNGHFHWSNSFPVGIAVLKTKFHKSEPISGYEMKQITDFLKTNLAKFLYASKDMKFESLIGASGSFEVLSGMYKTDIEKDLTNDVELDFFEEKFAEIISENLKQRLLRTDLPNDRAALIVVAFLLMKFVIKALSFQKLTVSAYAMKEGMLTSLVGQNDSALYK